MFRTGAQMALLLLLVGVCLLRETFWWPVNSVDEAFADHVALADRALATQLQGRGWQAAPQAAPLVLVAIDENSLNGHPWPWSPLDFSLFLRAGQNFKPEVMAIAEVLNWDHSNLPVGERQKLPQYEKMLRDSLLRTPKVLLGQRLGWPDDPDAVPPVSETPLIRRVQGDLRQVPEWTVIEEQAKEDFRLSSTVGYTNLPQGRPSTTTIPLVLRYQGEIVPTFALQAVLLWNKLSTDDVEVALGSHIAIGPKLRVPIDRHGQMRLNFAVPYTRMGFDELLLAAEQVAAKQKPTAPVDRLAGSIALLARTDAADRTMPVALRKHVSPGEILAAGIATLQSGAFVERIPRWFDAGLIAAAVIAGFWIPRFAKRKVALWCAVLFVLYLAAAFALFHFQTIWLPLILPLGLLVFIALYRAATPNSVWKLRRPIIL
jgi:CHASE2 domain-containing sensor protein